MIKMDAFALAPNASPEDRAAQHGVKLLAAYLTARCTAHGVGPQPSQHFSDFEAPFQPGPGEKGRNSSRVPQHRLPPRTSPTAKTGPGPAAIELLGQGVGSCDAKAAVQLGSSWLGATHQLLLTATQCRSAMVQGAILTALCDLPPSLLFALAWPPELRQTVADAGAKAVGGGTSPAVRAAGCKLLGALCSMPAALCGTAAGAECPAIPVDGELVESLLGEALHEALEDEVLSVRIAASWALATAASTLAAWAAQPCGSPHGLAPMLGSLPPLILRRLPGLCISAGRTAAGEVDKVRANGVLAVGALMQCVLALPPGSPQLSDSFPADR